MRHSYDFICDLDRMTSKKNIAVRRDNNNLRIYDSLRFLRV